MLESKLSFAFQALRHRGWTSIRLGPGPTSTRPPSSARTSQTTWTTRGRGHRSSVNAGCAWGSTRKARASKRSSRHQSISGRAASCPTCILQQAAVQKSRIPHRRTDQMADGRKKRPCLRVPKRKQDRRSPLVPGRGARCWRWRWKAVWFISRGKVVLRNTNSNRHHLAFIVFCGAHQSVTSKTNRRTNGASEKSSQKCWKQGRNTCPRVP